MALLIIELRRYLTWVYTPLSGLLAAQALYVASTHLHLPELDVERGISLMATLLSAIGLAGAFTLQVAAGRNRASRFATWIRSWGFAISSGTARRILGVRILLMTCSVILGVAGLYVAGGQNHALDHTNPGTRFCAALGEREPISLPDGTRLELNSGTCIFAETTANRRAVRLESGEALFQVARDPRRPFVVETGPISIEDVGTEFDVYRREFSTRVAVVEGAVQIPSRGTNPRLLTALQQMDVPDDTEQAGVRRTITRGDFDRMTAWVHGDVVLDHQTLKEAIDEFARYQCFQTEFADPRIAEMRISGVFHVTDVESFLDLLKLKCIHSQYDKVTQRITFTREAGKRPRDVCQ